MIGIVIVTHGHLANEFISALEHVTGKQQQVQLSALNPMMIWIQCVILLLKM